MTVETPLTAAQERLAHSDPDMPVFSVLAQDILAAETVTFWIRRAMERGVNAEKIEGARQRLAQIRKYEPKKLPD